MLVTPDFSEVADQITPGTYKVRVTKGDIKQWKEDDPKSTYVNWTLETFGDDNTKNNGRKIFYKTSTSGKGAFMLQQFYRAATGSALTGKFDTEQLYGKELAVEMVDGVNYKTGEPTGYPDVKRVKSINS